MIIANVFRISAEVRARHDETTSGGKGIAGWEIQRWTDFYGLIQLPQSGLR